jgi:xanthine dehydrogenase accessory factor
MGAQLAVTVGDLWCGGLSGGFAELAVLTEAQALMEFGGRRASLLSLAPEEAGTAGAVPGATLQVLVECVDAGLLVALEEVLELAAEGRAVTWRRDYARTTDVGPALERRGARVTPAGAAEPGLRIQGSVTSQFAVGEVVEPPPRALVAGGGDIAAELLRLMGRQGWRTALLDPRDDFVDHTLSEAVAGQVVRAWPDPDVFLQLLVDAGTACIAVAHDDRLDLPFLREALRSDAFYVGAAGSGLVQQHRRQALAADLDEHALARLHAPAGLDLGARDAAQIALGIAAEMTACWQGRSGATPVSPDRYTRA